MIALGGDDDAGVYDTLGAKQTRGYVHDDLQDLSLEAPVQQQRALHHEDLMDIEFETYMERHTSVRTFDTAFQAFKQQPGIHAFTDEDQDSQEILEPRYDQANPSSSPGASDGSLYGADADEVDELEDDYAAQGKPFHFLVICCR